VSAICGCVSAQNPRESLAYPLFSSLISETHYPVPNGDGQLSQVIRSRKGDPKGISEAPGMISFQFSRGWYYSSTLEDAGSK